MKHLVHFFFRNCHISKDGKFFKERGILCQYIVNESKVNGKRGLKGIKSFCDSLIYDRNCDQGMYLI